MRKLPNRLKKGDIVGIIAPASPPTLEHLEKGLAFLTELGLRYELGASIKKVDGFLAGTDEERLADLHRMFENPAIKAIICACGGYGTARITPKIDFELIAKNRKIFWGYSDITYVHTAIGQKSNLVTFHGPMICSDIGRDTFSEQSRKQFQQLFEPTILQYDQQVGPIETLVPGVVTAEVVGGNLSLLTQAIGTSYALNTDEKILFIEDVGEEPYRVDGMLTQLKQAGHLQKLAGVIIGDFSETTAVKQVPSRTMEEVFHDFFSSLGIPVVSGIKIGHCEPHFAIPLGIPITLDATNRIIRFQAGVN